MSISKLCLTCALRDKKYPYRGSCSGREEIEKCSYYFNVYVWRKQEEEKEIEIQRKKDIAKKNRERPLTFKPFKCLI